MKLICPMFSSTRRWQECKKEECAWWEEPLGVCCIRAQEATLGVILEQLTKLVHKMPHEEQF